MSFTILTDSDARLTQTVGYGAVMTKLTTVHHGRATDYDVIHSPTEAAPLRVAQTKPSPSRRPLVSPSPSVGEAVGRVLRRATMLGKALRETQEDPVEKANIGFDLLEALSELWGYRDAREENWGDLLNVLQCVLKRESFEQLSAVKCECIERSLSEWLSSRYLQKEDIERALDCLVSAGFDPWVGISTGEEAAK